MTDGREHIVEHHASWDVVMDVAGCQERQADLPRELLELGEARAVVDPAMQLGEQVAAVGGRCRGSSKDRRLSPSQSGPGFAGGSRFVQKVVGNVSAGSDLSR